LLLVLFLKTIDPSTVDGDTEWKRR